MSTVDNRIVQMSFDNKQFEDGIRTSTKSLDNFKQSLDMDGAGKGLDGLSRAVDTISSKFSAMSVMGITALANITNSAINAGKSLISSLTIDPIRTGLQEYETKMNAITTILTNTQGGTRSVAQSGMSAINASAEASAKAVGGSSEAALSALRKANEKRVKEFQKAADSELQILQENQDKEKETLQTSLDDEINALKSAHKEKLNIYDQEYMAKLKVIDEDRYTKIKAIDDEIKALKGATKAEQQKNAQDEEQAKILELEEKLRRATTIEERIPIENALNDLKAKAQKEQAQAERDARIDSLNETKDNLNQEYDQKIEALKSEYKEKAQQENDLYDVKITSLKKQEDEQLKSLDKTHKIEKDQLKEQQDDKLSAIRDAQDAEIEALNKTQGVALKNLGVRKQVEVKGSNLDDVNKALAELNVYADKTIYDFAQMTDNVGKFTAAGVGLQDSVTVVKGMGNVAAGFGVDAERMAGATYQMSQALAAGTVRLEDWMSMERTGMGGPMLQNALIKTAKDMGIVVNQNVAFRDSLKDGWLTADVFIKTMDKMANDPALLKAATNITTFTKLLDVMRESVQSGWAMSWEYILGDKNESTKLFTDIGNGFANIAGESAKARNETLKFWNDNGGRDAIIEGITNAFKGLQAVLGPIGQGFREIFPAMTGERLVELSKKFRDVTEQFKMGAETIDNIKLSFKGLFAVFDIGLQGLKLVSGIIVQLIKALIPGTNNVLSFTGSIGQFLVSLDETIKKSGFVQTALDNIGKGFASAKEGIGKLIDLLSPALGNVLTTLKDILWKLGDALGSVFGGTKVLASGLDDTRQTFSGVTDDTNKFKDALDKIVGVFKKIKDGIVAVAKGIGSVLSPILESIKKKFDEFSLQDIGALLTGTGLIIFAKTLAKGLSTVNSIVGNFSKILNEVANSLKAFQLKVKADALMKVAIALAILAGSLMLLSLIDPEKLLNGLAALAVLLGGLIIALKLLDGRSKAFDFSKITNMFNKIGNGIQIVGIATGILILAGAMKILASIDTEGLIKGTSAIAALLAMIVVFMKTTNGLKLGSSASGLTGFAIGITILAGALAILGNIKTQNLIQGVSAIATLMTIITLFINLTKTGDLKGSAGGLTGFAIGITILTGALSILGKMKADQLIQGAAAISTLMTVIMLFINLTKGGDLAASAGGLIGFATGILILTGALSVLGKMDFLKLVQGTLAISALMTLIANFIIITRGGDLAASAAGLIGFAIGIAILTKSLTTLGNLKTSKLIQGTVAIAALINAIGIFINVTRDGDLLKSAAGLMGFAAGLAVLSVAVSILAAINPDRLIQGVAGVTTLMVAIAAFISLTREGDLKKSAEGLIGFSTGLMILAGVIAILSALNPEKLIMASVAVGALITAIALFVNLTKEGDLKKSAGGLIAFSIGIGILAASLVAIGQLDPSQIAAAGASLSILLLSILAFSKLTTGKDLMVTAGGLVIFSGAILILANVITILGALDIKTLTIGIGALVAVLILLGLTSAILSPLAPEMLAVGAAILLFGVACLAVGDGMLAFATGLDLLSKSGSAGAEVLAQAVEKIIKLIPLALTNLALGLVAFGKTLADNAPVVANSFMKVINTILDTAVLVIPKLINAGWTLVLAILNGIRNNIQQVVQAGIDIILNFISGISSRIGAIIDTAFKLIISFINGLADAIDKNHNDLYSACSKLITAIVNAIVDLIPNIVSVGKNIIKGLIKGFDLMDGELTKAMAGIANGAVDSLKKLLGIHSPSTVFAEIGKFSMMGFANGLSNYAGIVSAQATDVGTNAMDSLRNAIANMSDIVSGGMDMNPTIRPVLDLTNVTNGAGMISSLLNRNNGISVSTASARAASISSGMSRPISDPQNGSSSVTPSVDAGSIPKPMNLQLVLQNGKVIAEYILDDVNALMGRTNKLAGRSAGI